jgi:hypothetical protein
LGHPFGKKFGIFYFLQTSINSAGIIFFIFNLNFKYPKNLNFILLLTLVINMLILKWKLNQTSGSNIAQERLLEFEWMAII